MSTRPGLRSQAPLGGHICAGDGARVADIGQAQVELDRLEARQTEMLGWLQRDTINDDRAQAGPVEWRLAAMCADVACELRLSERVVQRLMNLGDQLISQLTATLQAWRKGMVTRRHVEVIAKELTGLSDCERSACESRLIDAVVDDHMTPAEIRRLGRRLREQLREESPYERHLQARTDRHVALQPADDGMAWLSTLLPAVEAAACYDRIRSIAAGVKRSDAGGHACSGSENRTLSQMHADVLRDLLIHGVVPGTDSPSLPGSDLNGASRSPEADPTHTNAVSEAAASSATRTTPARTASGLGTGIIARVTVTVPVISLAKGLQPQAASHHAQTTQSHHAQTTHRIAELEGVGPISVETARELAAESSVLFRMMTDPSTGAALSLDRKRYRPSADLREFVRARDATCRFPGCLRAAHHCEVDHTIDWQWNGPTNADNLACLCRRHHVMKHQSDWRVKQIGDAVLRWVSPTGATYKTLPHTAAGRGPIPDEAPF